MFSSTAGRYGVRIAVFYASYFLFSAASSFLPLWLQGRGLSDVAIANVTAIPLLMRVCLAPVAGIYADRAPSWRFAAITLLAPAAVAMFLAWRATGFWSLLLTTGAASTLWAAALSPADALALSGVRRFGLNYGLMRLAGSVGAILANLAIGALLLLAPSDDIFWFLVFGLVAGTTGAFALPAIPYQAHPIGPAPKADRGWRALADAGFLAVLIAGGLVQASQAVLNSFGSIEWHSQQVTGFGIGVLWAVGIVSEIAVFAWSRAFVARYGPYRLIVLGTCGAIVLWTGSALAVGFAANILTQSLHGLTFAAVFAGTQHMIARMVPERVTASAQGLFATIGGLLMAICTSLAGPIYHHFQGLGFLFMVPLPVAALIILVAYRRLSSV